MATEIVKQRPSNVDIKDLNVSKNHKNYYKEVS